MASLKLQRESFLQALAKAQLPPAELKAVTELVGTGAKTVNVVIKVDDLPKEYLAALLDEPELNANQRALVSMRVHGLRGNREEFERIYDSVVTSQMDFASTFAALGVKNPNCEYYLNGRWYPITLGAQCRSDDMKLFVSVTLSGVVAIGDIREHVFYSIRPHVFHGEEGQPMEKTVRQVLHELGLRPLTVPASEYNLKLMNAERRSRDTGRAIWIRGPVLIHNSFSWWSRVESRALGSSESPRRGIIEPDLEAGEGDRGYYPGSTEEHTSRLPFVRVFSADTKRYVYVDVDDLMEYEYDETAIERLHLPDRMLKILTTIFTASSEAIFGDLIAGKHGGIVILASGKPGVGKTLTAEVYSELTKRPLYVLELGELGTTATQVEENLNRVFTRVARWDAVLQFDECEIFLSRRAEDLERSAIVGIFLRLLDYYRGILFLTTNRPTVLDEAVMSRVSLWLEYPDLDLDTRLKIWNTMLEMAGMEHLTGDITELAQLELNGRQVRNIVRLAKVIYEAEGSESMSVDQIRSLVHTAVPQLRAELASTIADGESSDESAERDFDASSTDSKDGSPSSDRHDKSEAR